MITESPLKGVPRILVVDDDPEELLFLDRAIQRAEANAVIDWVTTPVEARALLERHSYALILLDHSLGEHSSGTDFWIDSVKRGENLPVVFVSGLSYFEFLRLVGRHRVAPAFLEKPVKPGELAQVLVSFLKPGESELAEDFL
jgi:DNA-binding response OmpR family regulator